MRYTDYLSKVERGLCIDCGDPVPDGCDTLTCPRCLEAKRDVQRAQREAMRKAGRCACGRSTDGKHAMCQRCRDIMHVKNNRLKNERIAEHRCIRCAKVMPDGYTFKTCEKCLESQRKYQRGRYGK